MWYEILSLGKHPLTGVVSSYGTLIPSLRGTLLGTPLDLKWVLLSMSAEQR